MGGCFRRKYVAVSWRDPLWSGIGPFLHNEVAHGHISRLKSLPWVMFMFFAVFCLVRTIHYTSIFSYWANQELAHCCKTSEILHLAMVFWNLWPSMPSQRKLLPYFYCPSSICYALHSSCVPPHSYDHWFQLARHDAFPACESLRFKNRCSRENSCCFHSCISPSVPGMVCTRSKLTPSLFVCSTALEGRTRTLSSLLSIETWTGMNGELLILPR